MADTRKVEAPSNRSHARRTAARSDEEGTRRTEQPDDVEHEDDNFGQDEMHGTTLHSQVGTGTNLAHMACEVQPRVIEQGLGARALTVEVTNDTAARDAAATTKKTGTRAGTNKKAAARKTSTVP